MNPLYPLPLENNKCKILAPLKSMANLQLTSPRLGFHPKCLSKVVSGSTLFLTNLFAKQKPTQKGFSKPDQCFVFTRKNSLVFSGHHGYQFRNANTQVQMLICLSNL